MLLISSLLKVFYNHANFLQLKHSHQRRTRNTMNCYWVLERPKLCSECTASRVRLKLGSHNENTCFNAALWLIGQIVMLFLLNQTFESNGVFVSGVVFFFELFVIERKRNDNSIPMKAEKTDFFLNMQTHISPRPTFAFQKW